VYLPIWCTCVTPCRNTYSIAASTNKNNNKFRWMITNRSLGLVQYIRKAESFSASELNENKYNWHPKPNKITKFLMKQRKKWNKTPNLMFFLDIERKV
jgi:hypothetical protein